MIRGMPNTLRPCPLPRPALMLLLLLLALAPTRALAQATRPASNPGTVKFERWYQVRLADAPSGWMQSRVVERAGDPATIESSTRMQITVRRGEAEMTIRMNSRFVETLDGRPIRAVCTQALGAAESTQTYLFKPDGVELTTQSLGSVQTQKLPPLTIPASDEPGAEKGPATGPAATWLTPAAAERLVQKQLAAGAKEIRYFTVDPSAGPKVLEAVMKRVGDAKVEVMGKTVPATAWDQSISLMPNVVTRGYLDAQGQPVRTTLTLMPGMSLDMLQAEEKLARANINPPELMASTLIRPDRRVPQPRTLRHAVFEVSYHPNGDPATLPQPRGGAGPATAAAAGAGDAGVKLPETGSQRVESLERKAGIARTWRVTVDVDAAPREAGPAATTRPADLAASTMIDSRDAKVRELLAKAIDGQPPAKTHAELAERLRRFTHRFIAAKDLSVGMATASEVARTAEGDCTEHAVLLAALLRAAEIPSRTVTGVLYVDSFAGVSGGIFGYHMWTQAWIQEEGEPGRWVDFDAVMDDAARFDATHIALTTSSMADAERMEDMVEMSALLGRISIKVIEPGATKAK